MILLISTNYMNTRLEMLFEKYNVSDKDKYEINQIFSLLPTNKQQNILKNFEVMIFRFEQIHKEINLERRILIWDLFEDIKSFYKKYWNQIWDL